MSFSGGLTDINSSTLRKTSVDGRNRFVALENDQVDPLAPLRHLFHFPKGSAVYLTGHSLGLQPKSVSAALAQVLGDWSTLGVRAHFNSKTPWFSYHELVTEQLARLVGAKPSEVVAMNTLTVNLHLMLTSFYRPQKDRNWLVHEAFAFPSDRYAFATHLETRGLEPKDCLVELPLEKDSLIYRESEIIDWLKINGSRVALLVLGQVNYLTGQALDLAPIIDEAKRQGIPVGLDLAHGAGNLNLNLHDLGPDFAVWCTYKYMNSGPGGIGGCFVHSRHADSDLPRLAGWWGQQKATRFEMASQFDPIPGAEGWQLSNPNIFSLASLKCSLDVFEQAGWMDSLVVKQRKLTEFLLGQLEDMPSAFGRVVTPKDPYRRGNQTSFEIHQGAQGIVSRLEGLGFSCDFRRPNILRVATAPLYNSFADVEGFCTALRSCWESTRG